MCIRTAIQRTIHKHTKDGDLIAQFLVSTMQGETAGAKICHRLDAAKQLIKYGYDDPQDPAQGESVIHDMLIPTPEELALENPIRAEQTSTHGKPNSAHGNQNLARAEQASAHGKQDPAQGKKNPVRGETAEPPTHLDIINYAIARHIRKETADGYTIVTFLIDVMRDKQLPAPFVSKKRRFTPADRMAAAKELLRRGFGDFSARPRLDDQLDGINDYDTLHTDLAKRMRDYTDNGTAAVRFLLDVMTERDPEDGFSAHHRISAARELLRRAWDINFDAVTWKDVEDYCREQTSPRLSVGQKKMLAGMQAFLDEYDRYDDVDYEAIAKEDEEREYQRETGAAPPTKKIRLPQAANTDSAPPAPSRQQDEPQDEYIEYAGYGPADPDPTVDYYYEPLTPEEQAKFDAELALEFAQEEELDLEELQNMPPPQLKYDPFQQIAAAIAARTPAICAPQKPRIRSP